MSSSARYIWMASCKETQWMVSSLGSTKNKILRFIRVSHEQHTKRENLCSGPSKGGYTSRLTKINSSLASLPFSTTTATAIASCSRHEVPSQIAHLHHMMISDLSLPSLLKKGLTKHKIPFSDKSRKRNTYLIQRLLFPPS